MRFLVGACAGHKLADWLRAEGHDVEETRDRGLEPGDQALLEWAAAEQRVLITMDKDFGQLIFLQGLPHCGLIRLPDVPAASRIELMQQLLRERKRDIIEGAVITVRGGRVRISRS